MAPTQKADVVPAASDGSTPAPIILQVSKVGKGKVKSLLEGRGALFNKINQSIDELKAKGAVSEDAQPIIVVVKQKRKRKSGLSLLS